MDAPTIWHFWIVAKDQNTAAVVPETKHLILESNASGSSANLIWDPGLSTPQHPGAPVFRTGVEAPSSHGDHTRPSTRGNINCCQREEPKENLPPTFRKGGHIQIYTFLSCLIDMQALAELQDA